MVRGPDRDVTRQDVLEAMEGQRPMTTSDLAERLPCSSDTVYNRLKELHELDEVETKKVGARARVWWEADADSPPSLDTSDLPKTDQRIIAAIIDNGNRPVTSPDVAEIAGMDKNEAYNRLDRLADDGWLESKTAGANARVWWAPPAPPATTDEATM